MKLLYKHKPFIAMVVAILLFYPTLFFAQANDDYASKQKDVDAFFNALYNKDTGGLAIALVKNGEVVFSNAYGMANLEYDIPNTVNTVFHAASLSKQFTAYAILLLVIDGKIALTDDVRTYIPEVPDFGTKITLHQLASHTSGLRDQWRLLHLAGWRMDDVILNSDILKLVSQQTDLNFEPGSQVKYSNTGFTLLAEVVSRVSGKSFAEFTQERIFTPLKMTNSQFYDDYEKVVKNRAYSYKKEGGNIKKHKLSFSTVGATSLFTTVMDLSKWAIHLNTLNDRNPELATLMNTPAKLNNGEVTEAAMGQWTDVKFKGMEWFDHSGSDASFRAYFSRFPESNSAVVYLGNTVPKEGGASDYALAVADVYLKEYYKESKENDTKEEDRSHEENFKPITLSNEELQAFCGKYWETEELYNREIKLIEGQLVYYRRESSQTKLLPVGKNEFKMLDDPNDVSVFFEKNEAGLSAMRLNINNERTVNFIKYSPESDPKKYLGTYYSPEVDNTIRITLNDENKIEAILGKHDVAELQQVQGPLFKSSDRNLQKIEFTENNTENVTGLKITNGGAVNVKFQKQ